MQFRKYTKEQFIKAIANSTSIHAALKQLNVAPFGGNYQVAKKYIKQLNLNTAHMTGQGWNKGVKFGPKRTLQDYLSNKCSITSHKLKLRLLNDNIFPKQCSSCKKRSWLNKDIPLELHHKNGNSKDNSLSNITLLCPNCHALTDNYRGKAKLKKS